MKSYGFIQADVFTDRPFGGNPLAVFPDAEGLSDEEMQLIARELNLSETSFVLSPDDPQADVRVRFFTPPYEIPFAGHPTIGTHTILAEEGRYELEEPVTRIHQQIGIGTLPVDLMVSGGKVERVVMTQSDLSFGDFADDAREVREALGLEEGDVDERWPPRVASTGLPCLMVPLTSRRVIERIRVNFSVLDPLCEGLGVDMIEPFTLETADPANTVHARNFGTSSSGVPEDPATGSAGGALGGYMAHHQIIQMEQPVTRLTIEQGYEMGRPSLIEVLLDTNRRDVERVRVGGQAVRVIEGTLTF